MITEDILELKDKLLNPKRGDKYTTWYYLDGWRLCDIVVGNKKCTVKPTVRGKGLTLSRTALKRELESVYWYAAKNKATPIDGTKRSKRWQVDFA
tara:strand:- start:27560 stop:27844 length:285 start_codon:yes stop_codon:yes gene_type:complete